MAVIGSAVLVHVAKNVGYLVSCDKSLFVCRHDNSRTEEATNVKLHHVIQEGDG